ncbi:MULTISPECIES: iron-sulfur cluster repair di-iron protein [Aeribacillus]|jgi:regulator of cell morphogenesis and NO signaling|uniref:Iron-sulfur cluster repair di-iron protein n=3 Tax=Aeribacillus TaxID=1055323 RepID=A0A223E7W5_9BACI|nr:MULTISPECIES: iron-sulfur cluster repair di-iron protein [Aeribacillus]ASS91291.1 iron-sulfur cluster repair di-iron protein [Aeribacillus pallidus]MED0701498.1 iron-sulfur cluster repair di-iron protein [Aeribacillus composti]MED0716049.1 iron-sulfur cluster repair di-iron protein [Aeribacillus composti]MED1442997.1 iron-sulfur cluster repair di-iron protein [Aeribacillus composti]RZI52088.1 iron-sulfur cluster repair di-iron protein [Aeribacillus pallidus]
MKTIFTENTTVGEIVAMLPKASDVFKKNKIDFCCGGDRSLKEAADKRGVAIEELMSQLQDLYAATDEKTEKNWLTATYSELIDHIINKHHRYLLEELPNLSPYVTKVMRVHGGNHPHLIKVHKLFNELKTELEQHLWKEESEVFPLISQFEKQPTSENEQKMKKMIADLTNEHDKTGDIIKEIRRITNDYTLPNGACRTYQLVYNRLEALESDLFEHIHLENNVLFPRILQ